MDTKITRHDEDWHAARITEAWQKAVPSIIETGKRILEAKDELDHGKFLKMVESRLPFVAFTAQRLMAIARPDNALTSKTTNWWYLPPIWTTIYEITKLKLSEEVIEYAIAKGYIHPTMTGSQVPGLAKLAKLFGPPDEPEGKGEEVEKETNWEIITGDCIEVLRNYEGTEPTLIFADPPYNIGIDYGEGEAADRLTTDEYLDWSETWIGACVDYLAGEEDLPGGSLWILLPDEWVAEIGSILTKGLGMVVRSWIIWHETFGVQQSCCFSRCHRHLLYTVRPNEIPIWNPDAVKVPSDRQVKYGDKRADPEGKVMSDVWTISRVAGTHGERLPFPTQLPLELLQRVVLCCTNPGDTVLDPFSGSATTGIAAVKSGRKYVGIEKNEQYAETSKLRFK